MHKSFYDLVSHGGSSTDNCWGTYSSSSLIGYGPAYQYSCIHSGLIQDSGDLVATWYDYVLASAGTIVSENTTADNPAYNTNSATESICPKGWALPSKSQMQSIANGTGSYISSFSPTFGGAYDHGTMSEGTTRGFWWGSTAESGARSYNIRYNSNNTLSTAPDSRHKGRFIRCVAKQKTITDLAYMQDVTDELTTYDLVSHGTNTAGQNECRGEYDSTTQIGYGPGYQYNCIHSSNPTENNIVDSTWYNYTLASAGTIYDENTTSSNPATNMNTATESICPNGWTLPTTKQIDNNRSVAEFSPVLGGRYSNGALGNEATYGYWWGSTTYSGPGRYGLFYYGSNLSTNYGSRHNGYYIRCVSEEKTATDLTYMQDMTPQTSF